MHPADARSPAPTAVRRTIDCWNASMNLCHQHQRQHTTRAAQFSICLIRSDAVSRSCLLYSLLLALFLCCQAVQGNELHGAGLSNIEELILDRSAPPDPRMALHARQDTSSTLPSSIVYSGTGSSGSSTAIDSTIATAAPTMSSFPQPFDTSLGDNFTTTSCPQFFNTFLSNRTFQECMPISLLLQTSNSFFTATRSPLTLALTLSASCSVSYPTCSTLMANYATQLQFACTQDLSLENPQVLQAYEGFTAYKTLYAAACLTNSNTGNYCFADAVSNSSAPASSYVYYLPLGVQLPSGSRPGCTECLKETMAIFEAQAGNESSALWETYGPAAQQVDGYCGTGFVQQAVMHSGAMGKKNAALWAAVGLAVALFW